MGYYVSTEAVDVFVPAEVAESAVMLLDAMGLGACALEGVSPVQALAEVLGDSGFEVSDTAAGVRIEWYNDKSCNEGSVLVALAPFVAEGSFMEWRGEEGERWRDVVRSGAVVHQFVESVNWADRGRSVPPQFVTFVPVTFRPSDVEMVTGHLVCDGMLTPGQAAALTAALFKGRYFRPCWKAAPFTPNSGWPSNPFEVNSRMTFTQSRTAWKISRSARTSQVNSSSSPIAFHSLNSRAATGWPCCC